MKFKINWTVKLLALIGIGHLFLSTWMGYESHTIAVVMLDGFSFLALAAVLALSYGISQGIDNPEENRKQARYGEEKV